MKIDWLYKNVFVKNISQLLLVVTFAYLCAISFWQLTHIGATLNDFFISNVKPISSHQFLSIKYLEIYSVVLSICFFYLKSKLSDYNNNKILVILIILLSISINAQSIVDNFSLLKSSIFGISPYTFFSKDNLWFWQNFIFVISISYFILIYLLVPIQKKFNFSFKKYWVYILISFSSILYIILTCIRHWQFGSGAMDIGGYDQMVWGFSQFKFLPSTVYEWGNLLGDHFEPILILISPFYWIYKGPYTLLVIQSIWVCIGAYPIFLLAHKKLGSNFLAFCMSFSYLFFIGVVDAIWYDFHPLTLTATFIAFVLWFMETKKTRWYWIAILGLLLCKETTSIYVFFIGLYVFFIRRERKLGLLTMLAGVFWYLFAMKFMMGIVFGTKYKYMEAFQLLGNNPFEILKTLITNPFYAFKTMFSPELKINTWLGLFSSFGFLSFFSPATLIMALPMLGEKFLGSKINFYMMWFHYAVSIAPILIYSAINGIINIKKRYKLDHNFIRFSGIFVALSVIMVTWFYYSVTSQNPLLRNLTNKDYYALESFKQDLYKAIDLIPDNASVLTQNAIVPHVSSRVGIYDFYPVPEFKNTDYILISPAIGYPEVPHQLMDNFLSNLLYNNDTYHIVYSNNNVYLFEKNNIK